MCVVANADTGNRPAGIQSLETAVGGRPKNVVDDTFRSRKFEVTAVAYVECLIAKAKTTDPYHLDNRDRVGAKDNVGCQINRGGVLGKFSCPSTPSFPAFRCIPLAMKRPVALPSGCTTDRGTVIRKRVPTLSRGTTMKAGGQIQRRPDVKGCVPTEGE
jgi:hypothetical protein